jgi:hypothetical protein
MVVDYRWRYARQRTRWWRKMNTRFIQVWAVNYVIPYILRLCGLYWYVMMMCYKYCIHGGHDIYSNWLGFLDQQVVSACSALFTEQFGDPRGAFWWVGPPHPAWPMCSHEGIWVYTPTASPRAPCILKQHAILTFSDQWGLKSWNTWPEGWSVEEYSHPFNQFSW